MVSIDKATILNSGPFKQEDMELTNLDAAHAAVSIADTAPVAALAAVLAAAFETLAIDGQMSFFAA